jgi:hypothetical protein
MSSQDKNQQHQAGSGKAAKKDKKPPQQQKEQKNPDEVNKNVASTTSSGQITPASTPVIENKPTSSKLEQQNSPAASSEQPGKSKADLRRERNLKQEAQRAKKAGESELCFYTFNFYTRSVN